MLMPSSNVQYEHIRVHGPPRERGRQYGKKAAAKIQKNIAHYLEPGQLPPWNRIVHYIDSVYLPALKTHFPSGLEEMEGIAEGSGVSLNHIIMVNARYDLSRVPGGSRYRPRPEEPSKANGPLDDADANECTSAAFLPPTTAAGNVMAAQNWDISSYLYTDDLVILLEIHPDPSENIPSMFVITEAGQLIRSGMNSAGLAVCANALNSSADHAPMSPCLPISLLRRLFLHSRSYPQAVQAVCNAPRHVSGNLTTVCTAEGGGGGGGFAMCLELTPHEVFVLPPANDEEFIIHTNHYLHPAVKSRPRSDLYDTYPGGSSWYRAQRFRRGIRPYLGGGVTIETLRDAFSDHLGYPQSLCQHVDKTPGKGLPGYPFKGSMTVCCVMYDLTRKVITTCKGTPCTGVFQSYKLDE